MIVTQGKKLTEGQIGLQKSLKGRINDKSVNVADIFEEKDESGNNKYTSEDIKAVLTTSFLYNNNDHTLLSWAILFENVNAFQDILNAARNIEEDLEKKILTEDRYRKLDKEGKEVESLPLLDYAKKYNKTQMIHIIEGRVKALDTSEQQDAAAGHDNSPKSPSFLNQNKGKFAIIGAVALVGTIAAFMSGHPIIGIIIALAATFLLATDKGRELCDKVSSRISDMFSQSVQPKEQSTNP